MQGLFQRARDGLLALFYPTPCRVCGAIIDGWDDGVACGRCWAASAWPAETELCLKCGLPLPHTRLDNLCGTCDEMAFARARACGPYTGAWRESAIFLKSHPQLAPRIRREMAQVMRGMAQAGGFDAILPVPLHPEREAERGFNQAEVIARALASDSGLRIDLVSLERRRATERHRAGFDAVERARSLEGAFRVRAPRLVAGRSILLVDDVMTTGATAHEAALALVKAGARRVDVLSLARVAYAPRDARLNALDA